MPDAQTEVVLGELGPGEIVGELGILTDRPRSATVVALEPTYCLALRRAHFLQALARSPALSLGLARLLARRLYDSDRRLARYAPDALTGLASRRAFHDLYRRIAAGARRRKTGLFLVLFDVHHLNAINDRFGYPVGDDVLRAVADALMEATRATDLVARYGADEFVVLLQDAGPREGELITPRFGEKLRDLIARRGLNVPVSCRVGIAYRQVPPDSSDELLREADEDMRRRGVTLPA
jgi:diguanylate cyclase (GGDEF)-like protein